MNIRHEVDIGQVGEALKQLADQADSAPASQAAAAAAAAYTAAVPTSWAGSPPTSIATAIDRLAALVKTLNSGTGA